MLLVLQPCDLYRSATSRHHGYPSHRQIRPNTPPLDSDTPVVTVGTPTAWVIIRVLVNQRMTWKPLKHPARNPCYRKRSTAENAHRASGPSNQIAQSGPRFLRNPQIHLA